MELLLTLVIVLAIALVFYIFSSQGAKRLSLRVKCLIISSMIVCVAALWCVVYGPNLWILIQAGIIIVVAALVGLLSSRKT